MRCDEMLRDPDGFAAVCTQPFGTEHSHHDATAREAVARGLALEGCLDCAGLDDDPERDACSNCDRVFARQEA